MKENCKWCLTVLGFCKDLFGLACLVSIIVVIIHYTTKGGGQEVEYSQSMATSPTLVCGAYTPLCPGEKIHCNCTATNSLSNTKWNLTTLNQCPEINNTITLQRVAKLCVNKSASCGPYLSAANINPENINDSCLQSRLTITGYSNFSHYNVQCIDTDGNLLSNSFEIKISGPPDPPQITSLTSIYSDQLTATWTTAPYTNYSVSINDTMSTTVNLTNATQKHTFTGLKMNTVYKITVVSSNCVGNSSTFAVKQTNSCPYFGADYSSEPLCPMDNINYTCALISNAINVSTLWTGSGFQCSANSNTITVTQMSNSTLNKSPVFCGNISAVMVQIDGTCYTSVLTIPTPHYFNGTTVQCYNESTLIGNSTVQVRVQIPPNRPNASLSSITTSNITVAWTSVPNATSYSVNINGSNYPFPIDLSASDAAYTFTNLRMNTTYNISLVAINCAGSSDPKSILGKTGSPASQSPLTAGEIAVVVLCGMFVLDVFF